MLNHISISVPHQLGEAEAKRRLLTGFADAKSQLTGIMANVVSFEQRWEGNRLHFEATGLGQRMSGRLDVAADAVHIEIDLPPLLLTLAARIRGIFQATAQKLLGSK